MSLSDIGTGIAMVLIIEGRVYALAPSIVERLLEAMRAMPIETRRMLGLLTLATGLLILWVFKA